MENSYFHCHLLVLLSKHQKMFVKIFPVISVHEFHTVLFFFADPDNFFFDIFNIFSCYFCFYITFIFFSDPGFLKTKAVLFPLLGPFGFKLLFVLTADKIQICGLIPLVLVWGSFFLGLSLAVNAIHQLTDGEFMTIVSYCEKKFILMY